MRLVWRKRPVGGCSREMSGAAAGLWEDRKSVAKTGKWQTEKPETHI